METSPFESLESLADEIQIIFQQLKIAEDPFQIHVLSCTLHELIYRYQTLRLSYKTHPPSPPLLEGGRGPIQ